MGSTGVEIAGLAIFRSSQFGAGINIAGGGSAFIWGNFIGTDSTGLLPGFGNDGGGITCNVNNPTPNSGIVVGVNGDGVNDANESNSICFELI